MSYLDILAYVVVVATCSFLFVPVIASFIFDVQEYWPSVMLGHAFVLVIGALGIIGGGIVWAFMRVFG